MGREVDNGPAGQRSVGEGSRRGPDVSVVLPCLNEVASVGACVDEARQAMARAGLNGEVVVVDNGSTDGSGPVAASRGARVVHEPVPGYGSALRAGIAAAQAPVVVMADADCTYRLDRLDDLVRPVREGDADLVLGRRFDGATRRTMPLLHRFVGTPMLSFLIARACGGVVVQDSQSGFRAFHRERINALGLRATGMEFASEMLIRASRAGLRVREVESGYRERVGTSKLDTFSDGWRHLQLILLLAPDLLLVGPGAALLAVGLVFSMLSLVQPAGLRLGSLAWQPVFFSSIALVLGVQSLLAGTVLAHRSEVLADVSRRRYRFVGRPDFPRRCAYGGALAVLAGLLIDSVLFVTWLSGGTASARGLAMASLAQSLLIVGGSLVSFGVVSLVLVSRRQNDAPAVARTERTVVLSDRLAAAPTPGTPLPAAPR